MREPRTRKEKIVKEGIEFSADFVGGFLILLVISLPMAYIAKGWSAVVGTLFFVVIIASCLIFSGNNDKKENKYSSKNKPIKFYNKRIFENERNDNAKNYKICKKCNYINKATDSTCWRCSSKLNRKRMSKKDILDLEKKNLKMKKCPYCGKEVPDNAIRCRYCKRMFENKYNNKTPKGNWEEHQKTIFDLKDCPHCGHSIKKGATRCPFCKKKV